MDYFKHSLSYIKGYGDIPIFPFKLSRDAKRPPGFKNILEEILSNAYSENYYHHVVFDDYDWSDFEPTGDIELDALAYILSNSVFRTHGIYYRKLSESHFLKRWCNEPNTDLKILNIQAKLQCEIPDSTSVNNFFKKRNDNISMDCLFLIYDWLKGQHFNSHEPTNSFLVWYSNFAETGKLQLRLLCDINFEAYLNLSKMYSFDPNVWYDYQRIESRYEGIKRDSQKAKELLAEGKYDVSKRDHIEILVKADEKDLTIEEITKLIVFFKKVYEESPCYFEEIVYDLLPCLMEELVDEINGCFNHILYDRENIKQLFETLPLENPKILDHLLKYFPDKEVIKLHILIYGSKDLLRELVGCLNQSTIEEMVRNFLKKEDELID